VKGVSLRDASPSGISVDRVVGFVVGMAGSLFSLEILVLVKFDSVQAIHL
jgi:tetrahydromethanopterin S-methyltransferase subunit F